MTIQSKIDDAICDYAQEVKDYGYLDNSPTREYLNSLIEGLCNMLDETNNQIRKLNN